MATATARNAPTQTSADPTAPATPPLENGDHLTRAEFERRYRAMPHVKKAELIDGIVHMASPVRFDHHSEQHATVLFWLGLYRMHTPGVRVGAEPTTRLDAADAPQPDAVLLLPHELGGRARIAGDGYVDGPPDLVVEVAASSASHDGHQKRRIYQRAGVPEYVIWRLEEREVDWLILRGGRYDALAADEGGVVRSSAFPGLWLDVGALVRDDLHQLDRVLREGLASPGHAAFVGRLAAARQASPPAP